MLYSINPIAILFSAILSLPIFHTEEAHNQHGAFRKDFNMVSQYDLFSHKWQAPKNEALSVVFNINAESDVALIDSKGRKTEFTSLSERVYAQTDTGEEYQFKLMKDGSEKEWFLIYYKQGSIFLVSENGEGLYLHGHDGHPQLF